ncbi:glycosyltransferase [Halarchaeum nitratireducens]|uniref:Glycosyl transferase n=1 Tax=Halarchaeum nitratireducens TaxID=489913 RepID=A0A830GE49_9EURY|nr:MULTISPECIES: glycosyltransferase [Halarchaeum]MBP2252619.1 glycosyltransferase involved in cell wall biosynthesis [Halarchaeum solikamskense]GGN23759.1 glycosyl transferase [Halarchaeum nitratireducens]
MTEVAIVATPDDGSCGVGTYAGDLRSYLDCDVEHVELHTNSTDPTHFARVAVSAGTTAADVVHVQHEYGLFGAKTLYWWVFFPLLWVSARLTSAPVVLTVHEVWDAETAGDSLRWLQLLYIRVVNLSITLVADHLVFLSETSESAFHTATPVAVQSTSRLPHGVNVGETKDVAPAEAKSTFGYEPSDTVVVEPGYVSRQKGVDVFVELADRFPDHEFLLAGGPRQAADEAFVSDLRDRSPPNVQITGVLNDDDFHDAFRAADLVVLPYRKNGQSGVFNWCAAYSLPVAGSSCDYFERVAAEWGCMQLFNPSDLDDTESVTRTLLHDDEQRRALRERMSAFREANRFERVAAEHRSLYRELAERRAG